MIKNIVKTYFLIFIILSINSIFAQELTENWQIIKSDDYSDIFIDPDKVVEYGNDISVWALEKLKVVQLIDKSDEILSIKTHYLFNKMKKRYAEIGIIYYDSKGGIVNRSSKSSFNGGPSAFLTPITASAKTQIIFNTVISYMITGEIANVVDTVSKNINPKNQTENTDEKSKVETVNNINYEDKNIESVEANVEDINIEKEHSNHNTKEDFTLKIPEQAEIKEIDQSGIPNTNVSLNEIDKVQISNLPKIIVPEKEYNAENERALANAIFTDGNLYCIQISSWKTKSYADREINKLLEKGFNAFIFSVKPKNKNSIWHRVRVGYFDSLEEAQRIQKAIKYN